MVGETELIRSANGDFFLTLLAFLVIAIVMGFFYLMKKVMDSNTEHNEQIQKRMDELIRAVAKIPEVFYERLEKHDDQAKVILATDNKILTTLENRPCIAGNGDK